MILHAVSDILSHLLREQRSVVVVLEDAHEMDEMSWKVLLSLITRRDASTYSLFVFTHEATNHLNRVTLSLSNGDTVPTLGPTAGPLSNTAMNTTNTTSHRTPSAPSFRGRRTITTAASASAYHDTTFLRLSYESTLHSLKQLKKGRPPEL